MKAKLAPAIKTILKKYNVKGTLAVSNHSTLVLKIKSGALDFIGNYNAQLDVLDPCGSRNFRQAKDNLDVNTHWYREHFTGDARQFLEEMIQAMKGPDFFDDSDSQIDYFHLSHYISIVIGQWNKPYELTC